MVHQAEHYNTSNAKKSQKAQIYKQNNNKKNTFERSHAVLPFQLASYLGSLQLVNEPAFVTGLSQGSYCHTVGNLYVTVYKYQH